MLDLSEWEESGSRELRDFKKRVIQVAKEHSSSFHCGEYRSILQQLGIVNDGGDEILIDVEMQGEMLITVAIDPYDLVGLSDEEQKEKIASAMQKTLSKAGGVREAIVPVESITSISRHESVSLGGADSDGIVWGYVSEDGRVLHACEIGSYHAGGWAVCDRVYFYGPPMNSSNRGENRRCFNCVKRVQPQ